jgi:hypothetical protein
MYDGMKSGILTILAAPRIFGILKTCLVNLKSAAVGGAAGKAAREGQKRGVLAAEVVGGEGEALDGLILARVHPLAPECKRLEMPPKRQSLAKAGSEAGIMGA